MLWNVKMSSCSSSRLVCLLHSRWNYCIFGARPIQHYQPQGLQYSSDRFLQTGLLANAIYETENDLLGFTARITVNLPTGCENVISTVSQEQQNNLRIYVHSLCDVNRMLVLNEMSCWYDKKKSL